MRPFWQPSEPERGGGQDGEPEPSAEPMQQAQEGAEADLGRGVVALQVGQEGHLGGQGGRHGTPTPLNNFQKECLVYEALRPADDRRRPALLVEGAPGAAPPARPPHQGSHGSARGQQQQREAFKPVRAPGHPGQEPPRPHQGGDHGDDSSKPEEIEAVEVINVFL